MKFEKYQAVREEQMQQCRELLHKYGLKNYPPAPQLAADLEGLSAENLALKYRVRELRDRVERLEVELQRSANFRDDLQQQVERLRRANGLLSRAMERIKARIPATR